MARWRWQGGADFLLCFSYPQLPLTLNDQRFDGITPNHVGSMPVGNVLPSGKLRPALPGTAARPVSYLSFAP